MAKTGDDWPLALHDLRGKVVLFAPGGDHIMMMGLHRPLVAGERVRLWLVRQDGNELPVTAIVVDRR